MQRWAVEWGGAAALRGQVTRDTLKPGEHVVVTGNPGRNPADHRLRLRRISRPADGWEWSGDFD
jgi:thiamine monophosphate kinase